MIYRRRVKSDTWHFCKNCSNWPKRGYVERRVITIADAKLIAKGEYCDQCKAKRKRSECK